MSQRWPTSVAFDGCMLSKCCAAAAEWTPQPSLLHLRLQPLSGHGPYMWLSFAGSNADISSVASPVMVAEDASVPFVPVMPICMLSISHVYSLRS